MPPSFFEGLADITIDAALCTFGLDVTYMPKQGGTFLIQGIFDDKAQSVDPDTQIPISSNAFTLGVKLKTLPFLPEKGDRCLIKNIEYRVIDSLEDGVNEVSTVLILHRII